jgi:hypothetical protein
VQVLTGAKERLSVARRDFDAATELAPYDANSITLGAVTAIVAEWNERHEVSNAKVLADRLTAAAALADDRAAAIGNLRNLYKLLLAGPSLDPAQGLTSAMVKERLGKIEGMQAGQAETP